MQLSPVERAPGGPSLGPEGKHFVSGNSLFFLGGSSEAAMGGGAQRPVGRGNEPKKTGAHSARARTRGQNPLVIHNIPGICSTLRRLFAHFSVRNFHANFTFSPFFYFTLFSCIIKTSQKGALLSL